MIGLTVSRGDLVRVVWHGELIDAVYLGLDEHGTIMWVTPSEYEKGDY